MLGCYLRSCFHVGVAKEVAPAYSVGVFVTTIVVCLLERRTFHRRVQFVTFPTHSHVFLLSPDDFHLQTKLRIRTNN